MAAVDGHLCIGGSEGGVTCLPLSALTSGQAPTQGSVLQLNPSNLIVQMRRRMGFASTSSVVAALPVCIPGAAAGSNQQQESLLAVHEDGSCHQWFVSSSRQGFSHTLASDAAARQLRPNRVLLCYPGESTRRGGGSSSSSAASGSWDVLLVWDVGMADGSSQSDVRVLPLRLQAAANAHAAAAAAAAAGGAKLEPLIAQPQQLQLEWPDASLLDARVEGQQLLLMIGTKAGASHVVAYGLKDWAYQGRCQLLQQRGSAEWGMKEVGDCGNAVWLNLCLYCRTIWCSSSASLAGVTPHRISPASSVSVPLCGHPAAAMHLSNRAAASVGCNLRYQMQIKNTCHSETSGISVHYAPPTTILCCPTSQPLLCLAGALVLCIGSSQPQQQQQQCCCQPGAWSAAGAWAGVPVVTCCCAGVPWGPNE
jgi:hypothetical protein